MHLCTIYVYISICLFQDALDPAFVGDINAGAVIYITDSSDKTYKRHAWMKNEKIIKCKVILLDGINDDDDSEASWRLLSSCVGGVLEFIEANITVRSILMFAIVIVMMILFVFRIYQKLDKTC